eukprot:4578357-Pyramimonas_sp.AAC.1
MGTYPFAGCRRRTSARHLSYPFAVFVEHGEVFNQQVWAAAYDLEKAFESISTEPDGHLWRILAKTGYPQQLAAPAQDFHANLVV